MVDYPYARVSIIGDTWQTRAREIRVVSGACLVCSDVSPSGINRPDYYGVVHLGVHPSGHIHNQFPFLIYSKIAL